MLLSCLREDLNVIIIHDEMNSKEERKGKYLVERKIDGRAIGNECGEKKDDKVRRRGEVISNPKTSYDR